MNPNAGCSIAGHILTARRIPVPNIMQQGEGEKDIAVAAGLPHRLSPLLPVPHRTATSFFSLLLSLICDRPIAYASVFSRSVKVFSSDLDRVSVSFPPLLTNLLHQATCSCNSPELVLLSASRQEDLSLSSLVRLSSACFLLQLPSPASCSSGKKMRQAGSVSREADSLHVDRLKLPPIPVTESIIAALETYRELFITSKWLHLKRWLFFRSESDLPPLHKA